MKLIIAEKPSVGREIASVLGATEKNEGYQEGNGYVVTWALGHLVQLALPEEYGCQGFQREHLPILPEPFVLVPKQIPTEKGYRADPMALKQLKVIDKLFKQCDAIIVATDAGREGELIFRYIYHYLNCQKPFERLWISSLTEKAIKMGFTQLKSGSDFDLLYQAAQKRSEADWLVGINATQALSIAVGEGVYSLGRVQTPTLAMVCKRYLEHTNFTKKPFFQLKLKHQKEHTDFFSFSESIADKKEAETLQRQIEKNPVAEVISVEQETVQETPPLLYDLTGLQKEANKKYGFSADETLQVAQGLYEQKYITYPRTGSKYISEDVWAEIPSLIRLLQESDPFSASAKLVKITALNKRMVNDLKVTDHHGLLITERFPTNLSAKEHTIYKMIAFRLLEAVSEPCVKEVQKISLEVFHKCFTMKNTQVTQTGWRGVNGFLSDSNKDEADICEALPSLPKGSTLKIKSVEILSKTTQPPALYTEAGLLSAMETAGRDLESKQQRQLLQGSGIGTPATRAAIIETLLKRGYVVRKQKSLIPTEKGLQVYHWVKEDDIANVTLTGQWEEDLQKIEQGEKSPTEFLQAMKSYTQDLTQALLKLTIPQKKHLQLCCPKCQQQTLKIFEKVVKCPDEHCNWTFFRNVCGKNIDEQTLKTLLETRKSPLIKAMKSKMGKTFDAYLVLNENAETSFEFPKKKSK
ncbi:type IA DNA topoisomerase [Capnocytophaga canis]|uniref:type IA DNA topoisomerase n=1 Tax=Capnocytophaga canis TaxID=1848903 RepID=UPI0015627CD1|nr:type IA DNA topoisomerase [Capnocytophaga canis]